MTGKPISSGGDNYRPIAREGDTVTLLNIDKIPEGREQSRTKAEIEAQFDRKRLNIDGTEREYLIEKAKTDGRPQRVYQLVSEATDAGAGKVKLVGETYVKKTSDKAGNSGQTYAEWLADYDAKKGTTEVTERMRPGVQGNVGTTAGDGGVKPTGGTGTTGDGTVKPTGDGTGGTGTGGTASAALTVVGPPTLSKGYLANIAASPTGATEAGSTVTITTAAPHGFTNGQSVTISGVGVAAYNGTFMITGIPTSTSFTYTNLTAGLAASGGGTATSVAWPKAKKRALRRASASFALTGRCS